MNDAEAYLKHGKRIQSQKFGRVGVARDDGSASGGGDVGKSPVHPSGIESVVIVPIDDARREKQQLPMKKKKAGKRRRGDSDSDDDPVTAEAFKNKTGTQKLGNSGEECNNNDFAGNEALPTEELDFANVASPSTPLPPVENVAQRINLLAKWFPAALQEGKLEAAVAPGSDFVEATVERMTKARDYVLTLRYGIEDLETLLKETRESHAALWENEEHGTARVQDYWKLPGSAIAKLVCASGAGGFKEVLAEFADDVPSIPREVAAAVRAVVHCRRRLRVPLEYNCKAWHELLDTQGPERGYVPHLSSILWLSVASATAMFSVITQRLLRSARALAEREGETKASVFQSTSPQLRQPATCNFEAAEDSGDGPRFFDNTDADNNHDDVSVKTEDSFWIADSVAFSPTLSADEKSLLAFLRYLMPVSEDGAAPQARTSTGYGVWLYAAFTTLDTPLDPDTARLAHDLFRTCCRHLRTLGSWKDIRGSTRNMLLRELASRKGGTKAMYASLEEITREDVLALYTIVVVLARFFRQNQDHFIPM